MKRQASIQKFFSKKGSAPNVVADTRTENSVPCNVADSCTGSPAPWDVAGSSTENLVPWDVAGPSTGNPLSCEITSPPVDTNEMPLMEVSEQVRINIYDIGHYCQSPSDKKLTNYERHSLLDNIWKPQSGYKFPFNKMSNHNRAFQIKWLEEREWLAYSAEKCGAFCKYCVLFSPKENVGKGYNQLVRAFVSKAFINFKKAKEMFNKHENSTYHKMAVSIAENIKAISKKKTDSVMDQLNAQRKMDVENNRKRLIPIIQTIRFCGRQMIALRGHRDSGRITLDEPELNDGNF